MEIKKAAMEFIDAHKPSRIDVDYIKLSYGSVEAYLNAESQTAGDCGERYVEVDSFDSKSGNPIIIEWNE